MSFASRVQWTVDIENSEGIMRAHRCNGKIKSKCEKESREGLSESRCRSRSENRTKGKGRNCSRLVETLLAVAPRVWCMPSRGSPGSRSVF